MLPPSGFIRALRLERDGVPDFAKYPFAIPAIRELERLELHRAVTFFVGENGSGKSTLLEALAVRCGFNPEGGSKNFRFDTRASHSGLHRHLTLERGARHPSDGYFLRAESFYNVASNIDRMDAEPSLGPPVIDSYGGVSLHQQSHGEAFLALMMHRFGGNGLYLLDEPEAALSPTRQLAVLSLIHQLVRHESQFIIATHSPILMAYPHAKILQIEAAGLREVKYEETEHYQVTHDFLNHPQRMLKELLTEE